MLSTISYSESDIVALREMAELQYHTAYNKVVNETVTVDENTYNFDEIFMENCIYAGYNMNEAIDAAMQKHKLLNSQEMKLVKRLAKQTRDFVKKGDYESAIPLAKKRLAHLENMVRRAENIDDDEQFIITAETMVKSYLYTIIATHVLGFIINGLLPGSGPLVTAIKKGIDAFKLTNLKAGLAGKSFGAAVTFIAGKFLTISGAAKLTGSYIAARKQRKWKKTRAGDVNREVNEGRPDTTHLSISRTQAKVKLKKLIQAQKEEIKILEDSAKIQAQKAKADNKLATVAEAADPESARLRRDVQVALNIKNGKSTKAVPNPFAVAAVDCPADKFEQYLKNAAKPNPKPFSKYLDKMNDEVKAKNAKAVTLIKSSMNHPVVFFHDSFEGALEFYDVTTGKIVNLSYDSGKVHIDGPYNVAAYLKMHANAQDPDRAKYQQIAKTLSESAEVLDEGILSSFGASKYAKQFAGLLKTAQAVKNGTANGQIPSLEALSYIKCDPKIIENYFRKIAKKDPKIFDDFMSYVSNELDEDDERISVLKRKLMPHKNNPIVNLHANHPVKSEIFFYDASDNMIYQVSEDDDFDFNRTSVSAQLKESYPDIFEKDYKKAMKIAGIKESAEILDEKFFGKHKADTNKKSPEKKANNAPVNAQELNRAKQEIQAALNLKNGKSVSSIPQLPILAFVNCPPDALEKYMQDNASKNSKIIENQIDDMIEYVDRYSSGRGIKDSDPKKYEEVQKDCKDAEERLRKMVNHKLFFFDTDADPETPLCFYDADSRKWVESSYLDGEAYVTEETVAGMLKKQEKRLRSTYMQSKVSLYQKALQDMKAELSESANVLDEKFFRSPMLDMIEKRKEKKAKLAADREAAWKRAKTEVSVALSVKNGKMPNTTPHPAALAFVKCPPDIVEKYAQAKAKKNPKVIEDQIDGMNEYIEMYYDDNDTEEYAKLEKDRKYVEDYLKKAMTHRVFFFDTYSDRVSPLCYYDADTKTWVETGYYEAEAYVNEFYLSEMLKEKEKALRESFMQDRVSLYRRALQSLKNQLSESVGVLDEKFFKHSSGSAAKKPKKKKVKQVAISDQDRKNANKDIRAALDIKNGKSTKYVPNMYALAFVQCTPETLEKHMQSNATKNPRAIQNQINRMNAYLKTYYSDNNIKEDDPETYKNLEDDRNYVESYLKDVVNHRLFFFDTEPDPDYSFGFYDVDSRKWIETGYNDGEIFLNELSVAEILEICNRMLKEGFMQAKVAVYKKALQSIKSELSESVTLNEAKLKAAERNELPDSAFGIPSKRKFPLNDPAHVKAAVKMFRHASPADRPELARRIKRAIKKFNLDIEIGEDNPLHEYK